MEEIEQTKIGEALGTDTYVAIGKKEEGPALVAVSGSQKEITAMTANLLYSLIQKGAFDEKELAIICKSVINFKKPNQKRMGVAVCINGFQLLIWILCILMIVGIVYMLIN